MARSLGQSLPLIMRDLLVMNVATAMKLEPPYTAERICAAAFFTMVEYWQLEAISSGMRLTKTWRDVRKIKLRLLPMDLILESSARRESSESTSGWNRAAKEQQQ